MTLSELLVSASLVGLIVGWSLPALSDFVIRQALTSQANTIIGLVHQARAEGAYFSDMLICSREQRCSAFNQPASGLILVADRSGNRQLDVGDTIVQELQLPEGMSVQWRSFRNRAWLHINRYGVAYYQNGHFLLCYRGLAHKVILNRQAKSRRTRDVFTSRHCPE